MLTKALLYNNNLKTHVKILFFWYNKIFTFAFAYTSNKIIILCFLSRKSQRQFIVLNIYKYMYIDI